MPPIISSGFAEVLPVLLSNIPAGVLDITGSTTEFFLSLSFVIVENSEAVGSALEFLQFNQTNKMETYRLVTPFFGRFSPSLETFAPSPLTPFFVSDLSLRLLGSAFFFAGSLPLTVLPFFLLSMNANSNLFSSCSSSRRLRSSSSFVFLSCSLISLSTLYSYIYASFCMRLFLDLSSSKSVFSAASATSWSLSFRSMFDVSLS